MAYLDEPEYDRRADDRSDNHGGDNRGADGRRAAQPARPAWDAGTYGLPEDMRRLRPAPRHGRSTTPAYADPDEDRYQPVYPSEPAPPVEPPNYEPSSYEPPRYEYPQPTYSEPSYPEPSYPEPSYPEPSYPEPSYTEPSYPSYAESSYAESSYPEPSYPEPIFPDLSYPEPSATDLTRQSEYPGGIADDSTEPVPSRAGRNLPAAIAVGVALAVAAVGTLFLWRPAFLAVLAVAVGVGIWEMVRAIRLTGVNPPLIPLIAGGGLMCGLAWWGQADVLTFGLVVTVLAAMIWRLADGALGYGRDVTAATLVAVYVPFLAGFAALLAQAPEDGELRVVVTLAGVVLSDTGGYVAGVLLGRHPMAPSVSPKKSWEGLAGSLVATSVGGAIMLYFFFDVAPWWGAVFGLAIAGAAVLGDLGESLIKRDLGVKDMSTLLPGHGGVMDRLDSILFAAPMAYMLLVVLAPPV